MPSVCLGIRWLPHFNASSAFETLKTTTTTTTTWEVTRTQVNNSKPGHNAKAAIFLLTFPANTCNDAIALTNSTVWYAFRMLSSSSPPPPPSLLAAIFPVIRNTHMRKRNWPVSRCTYGSGAQWYQQKQQEQDEQEYLLHSWKEQSWQDETTGQPSEKRAHNTNGKQQQVMTTLIMVIMIIKGNGARRGRMNQRSGKSKRPTKMASRQEVRICLIVPLHRHMPISSASSNFVRYSSKDANNKMSPSAPTHHRYIFIYVHLLSGVPLPFITAAAAAAATAIVVSAAFVPVVDATDARA